MNTALSKKPASVLRTYTQQVRNHAGAMQRIQDQYFAALKRAEAQYFDGVKRITDEVTADAIGEDTVVVAPASASASADAPAS
jgi:UDP-N-acetylmuramoylalanine-D-glutamate ligase